MKPYLLTISANGNPRLRQIADLMVERAPEQGNGGSTRRALLGRRPVQSNCRKAERDFETSAAEFVSVERPERRRLDLVVVAASPERAFKKPKQWAH